MQRATRRLVSAGVVVSAIAMAAAAAVTQTASLELVPSNIEVIRHAAGTGGSGAITLRNPGGSPFDVGSITYSCGAAPAMQLLGGSGATGFQLAANGGTRPVVIECPSGLPPGLQRCTFTVHDGAGDPVTSFLGVCETQGMPLLTRSTAGLSFGSVALGTSSSASTVAIGNPGAIDVTTLQLQVDNDSFVVGIPCSTNVTGCDASGAGPSAGSAATVEVLCRPTHTGPLTGKLFAIGSATGFFLPLAVDLSCTGGVVAGPVLTITPSAVALAAPVEVQGGSAAALVQLQNTGSGALSITNLAVIDRGVTGASNDWTFSVSGTCAALPCALDGAQSMNVNLAFDPSGFNSRPASLLVTYDDGGVKQATLDLDGLGQGATLELVGSATVDFGTLPLGTPVTKSFALKNLGNRSTTAHLATSPQPPFTFPSSVVVTPGSNAVVMVTCQSATAITASGRALTASATDVTTAPFDVALSCDVRDTPLTSIPTALALGEVLRSDTPRHEPIQIVRVGTGPAIPLQGAQLVVGNPKLALGSLAAATPATLDLELDLTSDGSLDDSITVTSSQAGIPPITIPVTGAVVTAAVTAPTLISLGTFCVGQPTTTSLLTLRASGTASIDLPVAPAMLGEPSAFDVRPSTPSVYPTMLSPMTEATAEVTPKRGAVAGVATDVLAWTTTQTGVQQTMVSATFAADGGALAPDTLDFGEVPIRLPRDNAKPVTLQNCDVTPLELELPTVPTPFQLDDPFPTVLMPGEKATFSIAFHPTQVGRYSEVLVVRSKAGDAYPVTLSGEGIAGSGGGDDASDLADQTSFYACGGCTTNDPSGVLSIALVTMYAALPRRRRRAIRLRWTRPMRDP
jgi:hypothetical protein